MSPNPTVPMIREAFFMILLAACVACSNDKEHQSSNANASDDMLPPSNSENHAATSSVEKRAIYPTRYEVKDGKITYRYQGLQSGVEEVYFTNYGMTEIKFTRTQRDNPFKGEKEQIDLTTLMRDSSIYVVDNLTNNARKLDNGLLFESAERSPSLDLNEVAETMYREKGGFVEQKDTLLGLIADRWVIKETKTREWRWKGIMLKTVVDLPRNYVMVEAIDIDTLTPLPEGIFDLPEDVNVQDGISMKDWIEELSKPVERKKFFDLRDPTKAYDKQGNVIPLDSLKVD